MPKKYKKDFNKPFATTQVKRNLLFFIRKFIPFFNQYENQIITNCIEDRVREIKEYKSKRLWDNYYIPKATSQCIKDLGFIPDIHLINTVANSMFFIDLNRGMYDEFYNLKK